MWNTISVAQLVECLPDMRKDPGLIPCWGQFFSLNFILEKKWEQLKRKKTQVIGLWPMAADKKYFIAHMLPDKAQILRWFLEGLAKNCVKLIFQCYILFCFVPLVQFNFYKAFVSDFKTVLCNVF